MTAITQLYDDFLQHEDNDSVEYMSEVNIIEHFTAILSQQGKSPADISVELFAFSLQYGVLFLTKYLYEVVGVTYDTDMLSQYMYSASSEKGASNSVAVESSGHSSGLQVFFQDKYSNQRMECIQYLSDMKKYSTYRYAAKKHSYTFHKKYRVHF